MTSPPQRTVLLIGHSYVSAVELAWRRRGGSAFPMRTVSIAGQRAPDGAGGETWLNAELAGVLQSAVAESEPALIAAAFWGNQHFPLSTVNNPRPFDFALPGETSASLESGAELVPFDLIERFLHAEFAEARRMTAALRALTGAPILLLPAPPPLRDFSGLPPRSSDRTVDAEIAKYGVAPAVAAAQGLAGVRGALRSVGA